MSSTADDSPTGVARRIIDANSYATLATADAEGRPWVTPVWFAERDLREYLWVSRTERRHSQNVAERAELALVVFDSTAAAGSANAVYVEAVAAPVSDTDLDDLLAVFNAKCEASGLRAWPRSKVSGHEPFRLYRATASQVWVLDEHEHRVPVGLQ
ncbi:pyridoxamine 5'-phosphate oxidase family protein [Microbacterium pumilum]|uniref:Pyridoxamine 5'-phosphate oxidase N-terminal domain-containing protein n=1 Tax=Microbacterium pumilum TaxID=344165 RepID=A0ABN2RXY7_9MICO